jgi:uncharacterized membrane protein YdjX (TVP38/TMEM64 family)
VTAPTASPQIWLRFAPIAAIALALILALAFGVHDLISLDTLRARREHFEAFVEAHFLAALAIFFIVYLLAIVIMVPGAVVLSLSGGFLFGTLLGASATWLAATLGATIVFLAARTAFGPIMQARAGSWLQKLEAGFKDNAFNYLLTLRLFPGAPFVAVNLAAAYFGVRLRDFVLASLIGIIPSALVFASVGAGLRAALDAGTSADPDQAARDLFFSPAILLPILSLIALTLAPVIIKALRRDKAA